MYDISQQQLLQSPAHVASLGFGESNYPVPQSQNRYYPVFYQKYKKLIEISV